MSRSQRQERTELLGTAVVNGRKIALRSWPGQAEEVAVGVIHGARANSNWFRGLASAADPRLGFYAVDLSGHGDSEHAATYSPERWAEEVNASILEHSARPVVLLGHSMGGRQALVTAALHPASVARVVLVDTPLRSNPIKRRFTTKALRVYDDVNAAVERFVLLPPQPRPAGEHLRSLAMSCLKRTAGGWQWKFDPATLGVLNNDALNMFLPLVKCPIDVVRAGNSLLASPDDAPHLGSITGQPTSDAVIESAYHHVPLDSPRELANVLLRIADAHPA